MTLNLCVWLYDIFYQFWYCLFVYAKSTPNVLLPTGSRTGAHDLCLHSQRAADESQQEISTFGVFSLRTCWPWQRLFSYKTYRKHCHTNRYTLRSFSIVTCLQKTLKNKIKMHPDLAQQPSALSALSAVVPSGEPPETASPPFLHHTLCLKEIAPEKMCIFLYYYIW